MPNPPPRLVAIGDLHGDLSAALATLELAGVVAPGHGGRIDRTVWAGGDTLVVQMGDFTDRGPSEIKARARRWGDRDGHGDRCLVSRTDERTTHCDVMHLASSSLCRFCC